MNCKLVIITIFSFAFIKNSIQSFHEIILANILENNENSNIMISPLGIYHILSILANGADGETQKEILNILYPNDKRENAIILNEINNNFISILSNILKETNPTSINDNNSKEKKDKHFNNSMCNLSDCSNEDYISLFKIFNGIFINKKYQVSNEFSLICKDYNASISQLIDENQINNFCSNDNDETIKKCIEKVEKYQAFILINTIYFKGTWKKSFIKEKTRKLPFKNNNNNLFQIDAMYYFFKEVIYYKDDNVQMISLPYITEILNFKMIINLNYLISKLNKQIQ